MGSNLTQRVSTTQGSREHYMAGASHIRVAGNRIFENFQFSGNWKVQILPTKQNSQVLGSSALSSVPGSPPTLGWGTNNTLPTIFPVRKIVEAANQMPAGRSSQQRTFGYSDNLLLLSSLCVNCCLSNPPALPLASCQTYFLFCFAFSTSLS